MRKPKLQSHLDSE